MKKCTKCGEEKNETEFYKNRSKRGGLETCCKECADKINKQYYLAKRDDIREYKRKYREANIEYILEQGRKYREANREILSKKQREYSKTEKGRIVEKVSQQNRRYLKRYNTNPGDKLTAKQIKYLTEIYTHCVYCDTELTPDNTHIDHVHPLSKGGSHSIDNVVLACKDCNLRKNDKPLDQWLSGTGYSISIKHIVFNKLEERAQ
jgi:5-methylcytosine-specific restriction endonuclease McrA